MTVVRSIDSYGDDRVGAVIMYIYIYIFILNILVRAGMFLQWYNTQRAFSSPRCLRARRYRRGGARGRGP